MLRIGGRHQPRGTPAHLNETNLHGSNVHVRENAGGVWQIFVIACSFGIPYLCVVTPTRNRRRTATEAGELLTAVRLFVSSGVEVEAGRRPPDRDTPQGFHVGRSRTARHPVGRREI